MTVKEIVQKYLRANGYDGLYCKDCVCWIDDLFPFPCTYEKISNCKPGYKAKGTDERLAIMNCYVRNGWIVQGDRPNEST